MDLGSRPAEAITDPHFTFKPPGYFHLRSKKHPDILEGLVWTTPPHEQQASPWLRFVSNPVKELTPFKALPARKQGKLMGLAIPSEDMSVRVHFDFVSAEGDTVIDGRRISEFIEWQGITLHCYAYAVPGQAATLGYSILG